MWRVLQEYVSVDYTYRASLPRRMTFMVNLTSHVTLTKESQLPTPGSLCLIGTLRGSVRGHSQKRAVGRRFRGSG
ncbi:MAG: hypothetical protein JWP34_4838 [Massilia sp.]|jgi:hypothetical protein|nr:hypothetical protein [Massilia sp.]